MDATKLKEILDLHKKWLNDEDGGIRADLSYADLRSADLSYADLSSAKLYSANLSSAKLYSANLYSANLSYANLSSADLSSANLRSADLSYANLRYADLSYANLSSANLRSANLRSADLSSADLSSAINYEPFRFLIAPQVGPFWAYKKCRSGTVRVEIPADAQRVNACGSRKIRVSKLRVAELVDGAADDLRSLRDGTNPLDYKIGAEFEPDTFDPSPQVECSHGLHVFLTIEEAKEFSL